MTNISQEKKGFRTTILCIKRLNPSWNACEIATFLKQSENAPSLSRASLRKNPKDGDAKFADVWRIENVWGELKEKVRGETFSNETKLIKAINKQWRTFTSEKCKLMMEKIPDILKQVIDKNGEQIYDH